MKKFGYVCKSCGGQIVQIEENEVLNFYDKDGEVIEKDIEIIDSRIKKYSCLDCGSSTKDLAWGECVEDIAKFVELNKNV